MSRGRSKLRKAGHSYVLERLSAYIDEQLFARERTRVEQHLRTCRSCRDELRTLHWTRSLLQQAPSAPIPRSFVVREADVTPSQAASQGRVVGDRRTFGRRAVVVQWATALVAILLVLVVAGDVLIGTRLAAGGEQQAISLVHQETPTRQPASTSLDQASDTAQVTQTETPVAAAERVAAPTSTVIPPKAARKAVQEPQIMEASPPLTGTVTALPMMIEAAKATVTPTLPTAPDERTQEPTAEPPSLALVPRATSQAEEQLGAAETVPPQDKRDPIVSAALLARIGWRVAEVGLAILLIGLIVALVWGRHAH